MQNVHVGWAIVTGHLLIIHTNVAQTEAGEALTIVNDARLSFSSPRVSLGLSHSPALPFAYSPSSSPADTYIDPQTLRLNEREIFVRVYYVQHTIARVRCTAQIEKLSNDQFYAPFGVKFQFFITPGLGVI